MRPTLLLAPIALLCHQTAAWGVVGHEAVATIAQAFLLPSAEQAVKDILPPWTQGHLAPVAAWADRVRFKYHWSGPLHYVSPLNDFPPESCNWDGQVKTPLNVLEAVLNYTHRVQTMRQDEDLRFLVHYVGDMHQPLHLMERERGGNGDPVLFEGRHFSLHGVRQLWDSQMISRTIRVQRNYTRPGNSKRVESVLRGSIYDPYLRLIFYEGLRQWWRGDINSWLDCPASDMRTGQTVFAAQDTAAAAPCPSFWSGPTHALTCQYVFPANYDAHAQPAMEVGGEYYGHIKRDNVLEHQIAQGGIRLAAILNSILADPEELNELGDLHLAAFAEDRPEGGGNWLQDLLDWY